MKRLQGVAHILASALARKRADEVSRVSQERLNLAADAVEAGLWELNCQTQVFWAGNNDRALRTAHWS